MREGAQHAAGPSLGNVLAEPVSAWLPLSLPKTVIPLRPTHTQEPRDAP